MRPIHVLRHGAVLLATSGAPAALAPVDDACGTWGGAAWVLISTQSR